MKKQILNIGIGLATMVGLFLTSCEEEKPAPTINFIAEVDGYEITITAEATDVSEWNWEYGDGQTSTTAGNHTYTYAESGEYTISCTVKGGGGEATKTVAVTIVASIEELISGGPSATNGKTWVVNATATTGIDGAGSVTDELELIPDFSIVPDNMLALFGLAAEYDNEFTFYHDGTFEIDPVNDVILAGYLHAVATQTLVTPSSDPLALPFCSATYTVPENGTWALSTDDYLVSAIEDPSINPSATPYDVTLTFPTDRKLAWFDLSDGMYVGIYDAFLSVQKPLTILKSVTADKMHIAVAQAGDQYNLDKPSLMFHITLVPKE